MNAEGRNANSPNPSLPEDEVTIIEPDYALKKAIGNVDPRQLFGEEAVAKAQSAVDQERAQFLEWTAQDIGVLEEAWKALLVEPEQGETHLARLRRAAFSIKSQAGTFGYDLASQIARSLYTFCDIFEFRKEHETVLRKHIDAIELIFRDRITGDGGEVGQELLKEIERLVVKFRVA